MAHVRKDTRVVPMLWRKHLKPFWKRKQNKLERLCAKIDIRKENY